MSRSVDFGAEERRKKSTDSRIGKNITNTQIIIYVILTYNFSDLYPISCSIFFFFHIMSSVGEDEFTEVTRDRKKRKALSAHLRFLVSANQALPSLH